MSQRQLQSASWEQPVCKVSVASLKEQVNWPRQTNAQRHQPFAHVIISGLLQQDKPIYLWLHQFNLYPCEATIIEC